LEIKLMMKKEKELDIKDWGIEGYDTILLRQEKLSESRRNNGTIDQLFFGEHPSVVTIGKSSTPDDFKLSKKVLNQKKIATVEASRGGKLTFHGPGQLVVYPIVKLRNKDLHWYVKNLTGAVADLLRGYGLNPGYKEGQPGIWVNGKKISSIGVAVKEWVTMHGISLNVNLDLTPYEWFVSCGHPDEIMTSIEMELKRPIDMSEVKQKFIKCFCKRFGYRDSQKTDHPAWLKLADPKTAKAKQTEQLLGEMQLQTVCQNAHCPNIGECFGRGTATFMILGTKCTRNCRFCAVEKHDKPEPVDLSEPGRVVRAVKKMGLNYAVITSVTRDDLKDQGAGQFVQTINEIRKVSPGTGIEVLVPDFRGDMHLIEKVCNARPDMFNHNIETVPRLYSKVRPQAEYQRSLEVLSIASKFNIAVKSGLMLGLGEKEHEVVEVLSDLRKAGCGYLTLGQYLAPSKKHYPVDRYIPPEEFSKWAEKAKEMGFKEVAAGPLVRSSYKAEQLLNPPIVLDQVKVI